MTLETFTALALFAFATSITPGPNNLMLMASGANFGFRRTIPHMLGVGFGFLFMILLVGAGLVRLFDAFPVTYVILKVVSVGYLLFLAWKIAHATPPRAGDPSGVPITFVQAALFQWVNPKAWAMALTATSVYATYQSFASVMMVTLVFGAINFPCVSSWTIAGQQIKRVLTSPGRFRAFNFTMAFLLVLSLYPFLIP